MNMMKGLKKVFKHLIDILFDRFRFSIIFKLNIIYSLIYILFFFVTIVIMIGLYYIHKSLQIKEDFIVLFFVIVGISNIISIIFLLNVGGKISKKILNPINIMSDTVNSININDLSIRLDVKGAKDELKDLAITFNNMLDRLEESIEKQTNFVSDASHELRTPIAVIKGYSSLLKRWGKEDSKILEESLEAIEQEINNMQSLVEKLLFLARGDKNTQKVEKEIIDLSKIIDEVAKETIMIDDEHKIIKENEQTVFIYADKRLIKELIRIFVDNSIKYGKKDSFVKISSKSIGNDSILIIEDNGIGMSSDDLSHIFDRFYRADKSRNKKIDGSGLGLSIAKWILDIHNGFIFVESKLNVGSKFIIFFEKYLEKE